MTPAASRGDSAAPPKRASGCRQVNVDLTIGIDLVESTALFLGPGATGIFSVCMLAELSSTMAMLAGRVEDRVRKAKTSSVSSKSYKENRRQAESPQGVARTRPFRPTGASWKNHARCAPNQIGIKSRGKANRPYKAAGLRNSIDFNLFEQMFSAASPTRNPPGLGR